MEPLKPADLVELEHLCPGGVAQSVKLAALSRWRIGGRARLMLYPASTAQVAALRAFFYARGLPHVVIGLSTNLLFADEGLQVPCLCIGPRMAAVRIDGQSVQAQAGTWVPGLGRRLMQAGLTGAEHICGIPGTLGGLIVMNGGSQRQGIGSSVVAVESVDATGRILRRTGSDCDFGYRRSIYQRNGDAITAGQLRLPLGERQEIRRRMLAILRERRRKFPQKEPNCGSVFKSNPAMYAQVGPPGAVIERLGFKGRRAGGAQVSPHHANFIVNTGGARAAEVLHLIAEISDAVHAATGFRMEAEACYVSPWGRVMAADSAARLSLAAVPE